MTKCIFVTGTDTDAGKSVVAGLILRALKAERKYRTCAFKPVATGGVEDCADTLQLRAETTMAQTYQEITPFSFAPAIAPHIAATEAGIKLNQDALWRHWRKLRARNSDVIIAEGAGGWMLPLSKDYDMSEFVKQARMTVILVVGMKLGCINHARLTCRALAEDGVAVAGWIANQLTDPPMPYLQDNLATLEACLTPPLLGTLPYIADYSSARLPSGLTQALIRAIENSSDLPSA